MNIIFVLYLWWHTGYTDVVYRQGTYETYKECSRVGETNGGNYACFPEQKY